mgnify:CR=1 FL=1
MTVYSLQFTVYKWQLFTVDSLQFTVYSLQFTSDSCLQFTSDSLQFTSDICLQFTVYKWQFTSDSLQFTSESCLQFIHSIQRMYTCDKLGNTQTIQTQYRTRPFGYKIIMRREKKDRRSTVTVNRVWLRLYIGKEIQSILIYIYILYKIKKEQRHSKNNKQTKRRKEKDS